MGKMCGLDKLFRYNFVVILTVLNLEFFYLLKILFKVNINFKYKEILWVI